MALSYLIMPTTEQCRRACVDTIARWVKYDHLDISKVFHGNVFRPWVK